VFTSYLYKILKEALKADVVFVIPLVWNILKRLLLRLLLLPPLLLLPLLLFLHILPLVLSTLFSPPSYRTSSPQLKF